MKLKLRHNTMMRLIFGGVLFVGVPGLLYLLSLPLVGWRWAFFLPVLILVFVIYGFFFGWRHLVVRRATCESPLLPSSFEGYSIVQLSDIHIGTFLRSKHLVQRLVDTVNAQKADLVVFTGDLVNVSAEELIPFRQMLGQIQARDGVYAVLGNHDYCEYGEDKSLHTVRKNQQLLQYMERRMGWHLLMNEHVMLRGRDGEEIALIGVENSSRPPFCNHGDLVKAMSGLSEGSFKMLLSHDPSHWRREVLHHTDIALTLSGHTHAGQLRIGKFSPVRWAYNEWGGKYVEDGSMLYVSLGVGGTVPFRLGAWPEINVITLHRLQ